MQALLTLFFTEKRKKAVFQIICKKKQWSFAPKMRFSGKTSHSTSVRAPVTESIMKPRTITSLGNKG